MTRSEPVVGERRTARCVMALALAALLAACDSGPDGSGGSGAPVTSCPTETWSFGPTEDSTTAGAWYSATVSFPAYPCARQECEVVPLPPLFLPAQLCRTVQSMCTPGIALVRAPEGAWATGSAVAWAPGESAAGGIAEFEVAPVYPGQCASATYAWSVTVFPGPSLSTVQLDRTEVRAGGTVTLVAEFARGKATWDFGPLRSGVPATSPPLTESGELTVRVEGTHGALIERRVPVRVWQEPVIRSFAGTPERFGGEETVRLHWDVVEASGVEISAEPEPRWIDASTAVVAATTTFTLTARNPFGDASSARFTATQVAPPRIATFEASVAPIAVGERPVLHAAFAGGVGRLSVQRGAPGALRPTEEPLGEIRSGVPFVAPAQRGTDVYRLHVTDELGRAVEAALAVSVAGPGSFALLVPETGVVGAPLAVLQDGRVVVRGESNPWSWTMQARYLDVEARTTETMPYAFSNGRLVAAELGDGRVVLSGWPKATHWLQTDFAPYLAVDPSGRGDAVQLPLDGSWAIGRPEVLVPIGGNRVLSVGVGVAAVLDADAGTITPVGAAGGVQAAAPACRLADGRVLLSEGKVVFDPATGAMARTGVPSVLRVQPFLVCLSDGTALLAGGTVYPGGGFASTIERYAPASGTWSTEPVALDREVGAGVELLDGRVLLVGTSDALALDPATGAIVELGRLAHPRDPARWRDGIAAVRLQDGRVLVHAPGGAYPELFEP